MSMPSLWSGPRPNWRFKADDPKRGDDPDSVYSTEELMAMRAEFIDGVMDDYE
jgi:hypothetical protein